MHNPQRYAVIDLETTGFSKSDRVIEIGVVLLDQAGNVERTWETIVQPNRDIPNSFVHKLTPSHLVHAPQFEDIAGELAEILHGRTIIAHNAPFDIRFLTTEFERIGVTLPAYGAWVHDTLPLCRQCFPETNGSLDKVAKLLGITNDRPHAALADALATAEIYRHLRNDLGRVASGAASLAVPPTTYPRRGRAISRDDATGAAPHDGSWLAGLAAKLPGGRGTADSDRYRKLLAAALTDRHLSASEIKQLEESAVRDGISHDDILAIHEDFLRQLSVEAWLDGVVTEEEKHTLRTVAGQLGVDANLTEQLIATPQTGEQTVGLALTPGDRVTFTGQLDLPRGEWEQRAKSVGLDVGGVTKKSVLVVAANPDSTSGKARKARDLGVPIIGERVFAQLLSAMTEAETSPEPDLDAAGVHSTEPQEIALFPWLREVEFEAGEEFDTLRAAELWIEHHPTRALHSLSHVFGGVQGEEARGQNHGGMLELRVDTPTERRWMELFVNPLDASVMDLRGVKGMGKQRVRNAVERVVLAAIDAEEATGEHLEDDDRLGAGMYGGLADEFYDSEGDGAGVESVTGAVATAGVATRSGLRSGEMLASVPTNEVRLWLGWLQLSGMNAEAAGSVVPTADDSLAEYVPNLIDSCGEVDPVEDVFRVAVDPLRAATRGDNRKWLILMERWFGAATLDELGQKMGVTRERVRQLEKQMAEQFEAHRDLFDLVVARIHQRIAPIARVEHVRRDLPALAAVAFGSDVTYNDVFMAVGRVENEGRATAPWTVQGGWICEPGFPQRLRDAVVAAANEDGIIALDDAARAVGIDRETFEEFCAREMMAKWMILDDHVVVRTGNYPDRAVAVLAMQGEPMTAEDMVKASGGGNARSAANQFSVDPRLVRVSASKWALARWEHEEFSSIADWIGQRIESSENTVEIPELGEIPAVSVAELIAEAEAKEVAESSVKLYANGSDYQTIDGMVIRRPAEETQRVSRVPEETRDLVNIDGHWHQLVTVTHDHLRGSGSSVGSGLANHFDLGWGEEKIFESRLGDQRLGVNKLGQTNTSTVRRFLEDLGAQEGDRVFLRFGNDGTFDVIPAPAARIGAAAGTSAGSGGSGGSGDSVDSHVGNSGAGNSGAGDSGVGDPGAGDVGAGEAHPPIAIVYDALGLPATDFRGSPEQLLEPINVALGLRPGAPRRRAVALLTHRRQEDLADIVRGLS
ncbi:exonuclease domain-containing protein [Corynebacterium auriscanis]|uniref:exonuclease domain-containing protein n=1 Tax=Corynebacterium auriscanis TaxID=99807 RepID=UPI0024AD8E5E|nr:exonuclease domain-containing protein [Corynebacterium auriscanis]